MTTDTHTEENHAISNARGWMKEIREKVGKMNRQEDMEEAIREELLEMPLSVSVREGWKCPGGESELAEYEILLSTGGPALRIWGELGRFDSPENARMEWQDWGTRWTEYPTTHEEDEILLQFASIFYFGE
jgi:hypothetical protein